MYVLNQDHQVLTATLGNFHKSFFVFIMVDRSGHDSAAAISITLEMWAMFVWKTLLSCAILTFHMRFREIGGPGSDLLIIVWKALYSQHFCSSL